MAARLRLDDPMLLHMARDARFVGPFPFLANLRNAEAQANHVVARRGGCGRCGGSRQNGLQGALARARSSLMGLTSDAKRTLLDLLGTDELVLPLPQGREHIIRRAAAAPARRPR